MTMTMRRVEAAQVEEEFLAADDARVDEWGLQRTVRHHALQLDEEGRRRARGSALAELCLLLCDGDETRAAALREKWGEGSVEEKEEENANRIEETKGGEKGAEESVEEGREEMEGNRREEIEENRIEIMEENSKREIEENNKYSENTTQKEDNANPDTSSHVSQKTAASDIPQRTAENSSQTHYDASSISTDPSDPTSTRLRSTRPVHGREGVFLRFHPLYRDYFDWMLQDGLDKAMVEEAMRTQGLDPAVGE